MVCSLLGTVVLAIAAWMLVSGLKIRSLARSPALACCNCGHFLAQGQLTCPECGAAWSPEWLAQAQGARTRGYQFRIAVGGALLLGLLVLAGLAVASLVSYINATPKPAAQSPPAASTQVEGKTAP